MKNELLSLYTSRQKNYKKVAETFPEDDLAGPLLMSPNPEYYTSPNKLLIIGQETKGWSYHIDDIEKQMKTYEDFNVGIEYYSSPFWNMTRKVEKALGNEPHTCAWTNISKFDVNSGRGYGEHELAIATLDDLLIIEINILQPKVCIFFTGPSFDERIKNIFPAIEFSNVSGHSSRQLSQLKHPNLPNLTFRSYHPNYLRRSGLEPDFIKFMGGIPK